MKIPKQKFQENYMGKLCYFSAEYIRTYLKKKVVSISYDEKIPVRWKIQKHKQQTGWIVGFGFCFDGTITGHGGNDYTTFDDRKRVNYVKVRTTPTSPERKVPIESIVLNLDNKLKAMC